MAKRKEELAKKLLALIEEGLALVQTKAQAEVLLQRIERLSVPALEKWHDELEELRQKHGVSTTRATNFTNRCGSLFRRVSS